MTPDEQEGVRKALRYLMAYVHGTALSKGFWRLDTPETADFMNDRLILRIHGEAAELADAVRDGCPPCTKAGMEAFNIAEEEAADVVIYVMDLCQRRGWDLPAAILAKMEVNAKRPLLNGHPRG